MMSGNTEQPECPNCGAANDADARTCRACGTPLPEPALAADAAGSMRRNINAITDPLLKTQKGVVERLNELIDMSLQRVVAEAGPRQAEVLRRIAIPRWFDAGVLAVLRERADGNEQIIDVLRGYSFVRQLGPDRYAYHDEVRAALLREWQEQRPDELRAVNLLLAEYFNQRAAETQAQTPSGPNGAHNAPTFLPPGFGSAPPAPAAPPDGTQGVYVREMLHHLLLADPEAGVRRLRQLFEEAESTYQLAETEALLQVAHDAALDSDQRRWMMYLHARLERATFQLEAAEAHLQSILDHTPVEPLLAACARRTLGEVLAETGQWARAIECYQQCLAFFGANDYRQEAAQVKLLLGDAFQELGHNTGGWYVPDFPKNPFWRTLGETWYRLLSVLFFVVGFFLRRTPWTLPRPRYLASYQNWVLTWLYRTAQSWYLRARNDFQELGDATGLLTAEQQIADIRRVFGYPHEALELLNELCQRPVARDPYWRGWIDCSRAAVLLDNGDTTGAQELLAAALPLFRKVGDIRREAAALALQSRAYALAGAADAALAGYRDSLARFRGLRYTAAREQALHDLRTWRRDAPAEVAAQINQIIREEPEKRYVARFPRSRLSLLQSLIIGITPLILFAIFLPTFVGNLPGDLFAQLLPVSLPSFYDPAYAIIFLTVVALLYALAYVLAALAVVYFVPMDVLEREQPDYIVTNESGIALYDFQGNLAEHLNWSDIERWVSADRRIWSRPMLLLSSTYLEARDGRDLEIDGITGWYTDLQADIRYQLQRIGRTIEIEEFGFTMLRSKSGALLMIGLVLLLLLIWAENQDMNPLIQTLPEAVYVLLTLVVFSNVLIFIPLAYWFANRPLALIRTLNLRNRWMYVVGALGAAPIVLYAATGGQAFPLAELNIGTLLWGFYLIGEALYTLVPGMRRVPHLLFVTFFLALATLAAAPEIGRVYTRNVTLIEGRRLTLQALPGVTTAPGPVPLPGPESPIQERLSAAELILQQPDAPLDDRAWAYINLGRIYFSTRDFDRALLAYSLALESYEALPDTPENRRDTAAAFEGRARVYQAQGNLQAAAADLEQACLLDASVAPECPAPPPNPESSDDDDD